MYLWDRLLRRFFHLSRKLSVLQLYLMLKDFSDTYLMEGSSSANDGHHAVAGNKVLCSVQL